MVSERKLGANRRNAKRSTGPKNTTRSRYNAQKHGLLSKAAIIEDGDAKEDPREQEDLLEALWEDLAPEGAMEEFLVDRIANCVWRLRRAQRAEVGEIRRVADSAVMDALDSTVDRYELALEKEEIGPPAIVGSKRELVKTTLGIAHIQRILDRMRALVEEQGTLTKDQLAEVIKIYGRGDGSFAVILSNIASMATRGLRAKDDEEPGDEEPDTRRDTLSPGVGDEVLLRFIDAEIASLEDKAEMVVEKEGLELYATVLSRQLPSDEVLGKILRYETAIDRQLHRASKELRELQAARRARSTRLGTSKNGV